MTMVLWRSPPCPGDRQPEVRRHQYVKEGVNELDGSKLPDYWS